MIYTNIPDKYLVMREEDPFYQLMWVIYIKFKFTTYMENIATQMLDASSDEELLVCADICKSCKHHTEVLEEEAMHWQDQCGPNCQSILTKHGENQDKNWRRHPKIYQTSELFSEKGFYNFCDLWDAYCSHNYATFKWEKDSEEED